MQQAVEASSDGMATLRARLAAGVGDAAQQAEVVALVRAMEVPRRKPVDDLERFVFKLRGALGKAATDPLDAGVLVESDAAVALAPAFLGYDDGGRWRWTFHDAEHLSDEAGVAWMRAMGRLQVVPPPLLGVARELLRARRRSVWMPAAEGLARAALRDPAARALLVEVWRAAMQPAPAEAVSKAARRERVHARRHAQYLALAHAALGGDLGTFDPPCALDALVRQRLPTDAADASALLAGLARAMVARAFAPGGAEAFAARVAESQNDPQQEEVLRGLLAELVAEGGHGALVDTIATTLGAPRWARAKGMENLVDRLWSWLETARCFQRLGLDDRLSALRGEAESLGVGDVLALALGRAPTVPAAVVEGLRRVLDVDAFLLQHEREQARAVATLLGLGGAEACAEVPLAQAVSMALRGVPVEAPALVATERFQDGLECLLVDHFVRLGRQCPAVLLRDRVLPAPVVDRLVGMQHGAVAIQAAVQVGIQLQSLGSEALRCAELLRLSARTPPPDFFEQLEVVLRGRDTPTHRVCAELAVLSHADNPRSASHAARARLATALMEAAGGPQTLGETGPIPAELALSELARCIARASSLDGASERLEAWLGALQDIAFGAQRGRQGGLCYWADWLRYGEERDDGESELEASWETLAADLMDISGVRGLERIEDTGGLLDGLQGIAREHVEAFLGWRTSVEETLAILDRTVESEDALSQMSIDVEEMLRKGAAEFPTQLRRIREEGRARVQSLREGIDRFVRFFSCVGKVERDILGEFVGDLVGRVEQQRRELDAMTSARLRQLRTELFPTLRARFETLRAARAHELVGTTLERALARAHTAVRHDLHQWVTHGLETPVRALARRLNATRTLPLDSIAKLPGISEETRLAIAQLGRLEGAPTTLTLDPSECVLVGRFLLRHLLIGDARRYHRAVGSADVNVPSLWSHFGLQLANLTPAPFIVLDVGTAWDQTLAGSELRPGYWWVTATSVVGALGLMYQNLSSEVPAVDAGGDRWRRRWLLLVRVLPPWMAALAFATTLSAFILWTLQGTEQYMGRHPYLQALLWGGLSLFLGVFLNVTLQEKHLVRGDGG